MRIHDRAKTPVRKCRREKITRGENNHVYCKCSISEIPYKKCYMIITKSCSMQKNTLIYMNINQSIFYRINKQNLSMRSSIRDIPLMHSVHLEIYNQSISPGNICKTNLYSSIRTTLTFCINFYHPSPILYDAIENTLIRF